MVKKTASIEEVLAAVEAARDKVMADEVKSLTKLGIPEAMAYQMIASRFHQKVGNQEEAEPDPFEGNATSWEEIGYPASLEGVTRARRLARLLRILADVIAEPGLSPDELAKRAGVSERTLRRDLIELKALGYEVSYTGGYEVQENLNLEGRSAPRSLVRVYEQQLELLHK